MKRGDVVVFRDEHIPSYGGKRAVIIRRSRITGELTVRLLEAVSEGIPEGKVLTVRPFMLRPAVETR